MTKHINYGIERVGQGGRRRTHICKEAAGLLQNQRISKGRFETCRRTTTRGRNEEVRNVAVTCAT